MTAPTLSARPAQWQALRYFNYYRFVLASLFVLGVAFLPRGLGVDLELAEIAAVVSVGYWWMAVGFGFLLDRWAHRFNLQLAAHVMADIAMVGGLLATGAPAHNSFTVLLMVSLVGAGLVGQGRMVLFFASVASCVVLLVHLQWVLTDHAASGTLVQAGYIGIAFFAAALLSRFLAKRIRQQEVIAEQRGADLVIQQQINQLVIEHMTAGVLVVRPDGVLRQVNPAAARLLGEQARPGRPLAGALSPLAKVLAAWEREAPLAIPALDSPLTGRVLQVRARAAGETGDVVVFLEDVGKLIEEGRQMKFAALGRLTGNLAHEIRNPLSAITHAADLLREEGRADTQARLTCIIGDNAARLERIVRDVLELSRRDRAEPEWGDLRSFLGSFVSEMILQHEVAEGVVAWEGVSARVYFDRTHLYQVLSNLVANALRYSQGRPGSVRLRVAQAGEGRIHLCVDDDGPGVAAEVQEQLFEPFATTHSQGTGLGLFIARELCAANRATLEYVALDNGSRFRVTGQGEVINEPQ